MHRASVELGPKGKDLDSVACFKPLYHFLLCSLHVRMGSVVNIDE